MLPNPPFPTALVGDVPFAVTTLSDASQWLIRSARDREGHSVRLANAYNVSLADRDARYRGLLAESGVNFPDGRSIVQSMRILGSAPGDQVRGPSLFLKVMQDGVADGIRHYLVGSTPRTLELLHSRIAELVPGVAILGTYSPPFAPVDEAYVQDIVGRVPRSADIVWVGLGTPKQDFVAAEIARRTGISTAGVGAAFDFHAGTVAEAPKWVQRAGLEWVFRLVSEPRRLWRRYLFGNSRFIVIVARQRLRRRQTSKVEIDQFARR